MPHDLIPLAGPLPAALGLLSQAEVDATMGYAANEKAASTRACYASDMRDFSGWCAARGACPLPCHPGVLATYLSALADAGRKASTIGRRCAAVSDAHRAKGYEPPVNDAVRSVMKGIRRCVGTAPVQKLAATATMVRSMLDHCPDTLIGLRDRALLAFGLASAMRRSELAALDVTDLAFVTDGVKVTIRRSKTDQEGAGQEIAVPHGAKLRPVEHLQAWLDAANISDGPVFRAVARGGKVSPDAMAHDSIARIVKKLAGRLGLDPSQFGGHSLRSGYVTSAVEANAPLLKITEVTRHRSLDMLQVYSRRANLFLDHSGSGFL